MCVELCTRGSATGWGGEEMWACVSYTCGDGCNQMGKGGVVSVCGVGKDHGDARDGMGNEVWGGERSRWPERSQLPTNTSHATIYQYVTRNHIGIWLRVTVTAAPSTHHTKLVGIPSLARLL
eukprot:64167-Chlamydomonas_euryale.AAC.1